MSRSLKFASPREANRAFAGAFRSPLDTSKMHHILLEAQRFIPQCRVEVLGPFPASLLLRTASAIVVLGHGEEPIESAAWLRSYAHDLETYQALTRAAEDPAFDVELRMEHHLVLQALHRQQALRMIGELIATDRNPNRKSIPLAKEFREYLAFANRRESDELCEWRAILDEVDRCGIL